MKAYLLLFFLLLFYFSSAQEDVLRPKGKPQSELTNTYSKDASKFSIGFEVGGNYNMFSQDLTWNPPLENSIFAVTESGSGISPYFGVFFDMDFTQIFGFHAKLQYNTISYGNSGEGFVDCTTFDEFGFISDIRLANSEFEYQENYSYLNLELYAKINFTNEFFALFGPTIYIPASDVESEITQRSLDSECFFFEDPNDPANTQVSELNTTITDDLEYTRIGLGLTLGYKFYINENVYLAPQLHYHYMLTALNENTTIVDDTQALNVYSSQLTAENITANHLRLSVALGFDIMGGM